MVYQAEGTVYISRKNHKLVVSCDTTHSHDPNGISPYVPHGASVKHKMALASSVDIATYLRSNRKQEKYHRVYKLDFGNCILRC